MRADSQRPFPLPTAQDYRDIADALRRLAKLLIGAGFPSMKARRVATELVLPDPPREEGLLFRVASWHAQNRDSTGEFEALDRGRMKSALRAVQGLCREPPEPVCATVLDSMAWEFWFLGGGK